MEISQMMDSMVRIFLKYVNSAKIAAKINRNKLNDPFDPPMNNIEISNAMYVIKLFFLFIINETPYIKVITLNK